MRTEKNFGLSEKRSEARRQFGSGAAVWKKGQRESLLRQHKHRLEIGNSVGIGPQQSDNYQSLSDMKCK